MAFDSEVQENAVCCITATGSGDQFGWAVFSEDLRAFRICEYLEDVHLSRTEALLLQLQPKRCCWFALPNEVPRKLRSVAESCGVELEEVKSQTAKEVDLEQDLGRLLVDGLGRHLEEQRHAQGMKSLAVLIGHLQLLNEAGNFKACTLGLYPLRNFVFLDKAAFSALNVLPRPEESQRSSTNLLGFLNRCRSQIGQRRLRQWLTQPLTDPQKISRRHDIVEMLVGADSFLRDLEGQLRRVPDLERIAARLHRTHAQSKAQGATLEDLVNLYHCILATDKMVQALEAYQGKHREVLEGTLLERLRSIMKDFGNFRALVEQTIDLQQAELRNYCISTAFDPSLKQLAMQRDKVREQMEAVRADVDKKLNLAGRGNEKSVSLNECPEGLALRVTKKHQQAVQKWNGKPPLKVLSLKKTEVFFTTTELVKLNKDLQQAVDDYQKQTDALVAKALKVASTYSSVVERLADVLADLDVLCSLARVALTAPCTFVRAKLDESGKDCVIDGAVHVLVTANSTQSFVANSVEMHRDLSRLHLITGPNMGGKSTYIRSIALIALLNQMGSFVPCRSAVLPCFDSIMCRVGASDMQLRGISTFMAEMLEAACILNVATERSLVIVDELGRGTSTADGFGIAWAIAKHLVEDTRCFTLFATHFHELAALEQATAAVRNRHATAVVEPQSGRLTFLYALADGAADQSYGAFVAELAGFPERVVAEARRQAEELESASSFGRARKRRKQEMLPESVQNIFEAENEEDFVRLATENLPKLQNFLDEGCDV
ncbi:unnamed protein product [Cladocopium goreaui]|uniref:DNA mismatch repair protein MSH2 n=1 Tax=Cladocopium goreaui TaxID=2562237 RepID=A0A9P1FV90_9DINO|nr:unnamed protein product [Cladocopium goreaui]